MFRKKKTPCLIRNILRVKQSIWPAWELNPGPLTSGKVGALPLRQQAVSVCMLYNAIER